MEKNMDYIKKIINYLKEKKEASAAPLAAENAYSISAINENSSFNKVYLRIKEDTLKKIKMEAKIGGMEAYISLPSFLSECDRLELKKDLLELNYKVPHLSEKSMIVNWEK